MGLLEEYRLTKRAVQKKVVAHQKKQEKKRVREIGQLKKQTELHTQRAKYEHARALEAEQKLRARKARQAASPFAGLFGGSKGKKKKSGSWLQDIK